MFQWVFYKILFKINVYIFSSFMKQRVIRIYMSKLIFWLVIKKLLGNTTVKRHFHIYIDKKCDSSLVFKSEQNTKDRDKIFKY